MLQLLDTLKRGHSLRIENDPDYQYRVDRIRLARQQSEKTRVSLNLEERRAEQETLKQQSLKLANVHRKATGEQPFENYAAFEESEEGEDPQEQELSAHTLETGDEVDAYQTESARILLDLVEAFIREKQSAAS